MPNTTNFNFPTPADTDLVKDGASAIRSLGNSIDTAFVDLKGGTTGQVLSKASNTDLDFTWTAGGDITEVQAGTGISVASGTGPIPVVTNSMATEITASGDIIVGTGSGTFDNLPIGTTGQVLTADTTVSPYKVKWAAVAAPSFVGCRLTRSGTFNVSNNTFTAVSFNLESFDTDAFHDNSTNNSRITIPAGKAGKYLLIGNFLWGTDPTGRRELLMYKNGSALSGRIVMQATSTEGAGLCLSMIQDLAVSDYVELYVRQTSGQTIDTNADNTIFQAQYLGA